MKVLLSERVRELQKDPIASRELQRFVANAKFDDAKEIKIRVGGQEKRIKFRLVPQG